MFIKKEFAVVSNLRFISWTNFMLITSGPGPSEALDTVEYINREGWDQIVQMYGLISAITVCLWHKALLAHSTSVNI